MSDERIRTHWEGCWEFHPECAATLIRTQQERIRTLEEEVKNRSVKCACMCEPCMDCACFDEEYANRPQWLRNSEMPPARATLTEEG